MRITKQCQKCSKDFTTLVSRVKKGRGIYCSRACSQSIFLSLPNTWKGRIHSVESREKNRLAHLGKVPVNIHLNFKNCEHCKKLMRVPTHLLETKRFCSRGCLASWQSIFKNGVNSATWKGGLSNINRYVRTTREYYEWRKAVLKRDNYTCVECGYKSHTTIKGKSDIQADHIKPFGKYPELRFDINNGRVLCITCHRKTPTWGVNTRKDISYATQ